MQSADEFLRDLEDGESGHFLVERREDRAQRDREDFHRSSRHEKRKSRAAVARSTVTAAVRPE